MTYRTPEELPETLQITLPDEAQALYIRAYNEALAAHDPSVHTGLPSESAAHAIAWHAVEQEFEQPKNGGKWRRIGDDSDESEAGSAGGLFERIRQIF